MAALSTLEHKLNDVFVKNAPFQLPVNAKKVIVQYLPYVNLVLGLLTLLAAYTLWTWARTADRLVDYANSLTAYYGGSAFVPQQRFTIVIWFGLIVLLIEAVLFIMAFKPTQGMKKAGWDLLFYALLVNVVYGVVMIFADYGGVSTFISTVISTVIGLYFLFQVRDQYAGAKAAKAKV
ncbi:MAG: hypothetical protein JWL85_766 [Candidatus Saccharibacteria bacterium]|nr:hypothetical protein [Candidatus Saccharibacteria bacterium]